MQDGRDLNLRPTMSPGLTEYVGLRVPEWIAQSDPREDPTHLRRSRPPRPRHQSWCVGPAPPTRSVCREAAQLPSDVGERSEHELGPPVLHADDWDLPVDDTNRRFRLAGAEGVCLAGWGMSADTRREDARARRRPPPGWPLPAGGAAGTA